MKIKKSDIKYAIISIILCIFMIVEVCSAMDSAIDRYEKRNNITSVSHR